MTAIPHQLLHVAQVSFFSDPRGRPPEQLLDAWPSLVDVADAACGTGLRVSVVQASAHSERLERKGVGYHFLPVGAALPEVRQSVAFRELLRRLAPDVVHVHGLGFHKDVLALAAIIPGIPIVLQDHANRAPRVWRRPAWRRGLSVASGIAFCALQQARAFLTAGLIDPQTKLYEIPESTCRFTPGDQAQARRATQLSGEPAILWVGHLDANKDPLTVLGGISEAARALPKLQLYCCFAASPLLPAVGERVSADPLLRERVHLLGRVSHDRIEQLMRAADIFVLGSHREGSGYSLIEALACGLSPVVTDIPSFRLLTGSGAVGMLWPCDDSRALSEALQSLAAHTGAALRARVRAHFDQELSFDALGGKLARMYQDLVARAGSASVSGTSSAHRALLGG